MRLLSSSITAILFLVLSTSSIAEIQNSKLIIMVKKANASNLEIGLPDTIISQWVINTFKHGANATWDVTDCGEGGDGRIAPLCVDIQIPQKNGYQLNISAIVVSTDGELVEKPNLFMLYFFKSEGYKTLDVVHVKTIAEAIRMYKTDLSSMKK